MSAPVDEPILRCDLQLPPMGGDIDPSGEQLDAWRAGR